ncbi:MAG: PEP-CTERM sorting domain-containing protein [Pseudomonadota bacterium]
MKSNSLAIGTFFHRIKRLTLSTTLLVSAAVYSNFAAAGMITPDIIFGTGNSNRGFTVETSGSLELGIRAKLRYGPTGQPNDEIGVGIIENPSGTYFFDSNEADAPADRAMWNYDWSINSNVDGNGSNLDAWVFTLLVDDNPTAAINFVPYDPVGLISTGAYLGNNSTPNGGGMFFADPTSDLASNNVAQNSVNYGFLPGFPLGDGEFALQLQAMAPGGPIISTSINVIVRPGGAVPVPGVMALMMAGFVGLALSRRRQR